MEEEIVKFPEEIPNKVDEATKEQDRLLRNIFIAIGIFAIGFVMVYFFIVSQSNFEHKGIEFKAHKGDIIQGKTIYSTSLPVQYQGQIADYNFYLRNDPRQLDSIPFEGEILFTRNIVLNMSGSTFNCEGKGVIAIANLVEMYKIFGGKVITDENATCDSQGRYSHLQIQPGEITSIKQTGPACYTLNVRDCEILKVTEKLMIETFSRYNERKESENLPPLSL